MNGVHFPAGACFLLVGLALCAATLPPAAAAKSAAREAARSAFYICHNDLENTFYQSLRPCAPGERQTRVVDGGPNKLGKWGTGEGGIGSTGGLIRLDSGPGGHFMADITINGTPVRALVDTGASNVALSPGVAKRLGLDLSGAVRGKSSTANGVIDTQRITLASVELRGQTVRHVAASVLPQEMQGQEALLGMSFLKFFEITTSGNTMTLRRR